VDVKRIGHAGLVGWREKTGNIAASAISKRTPLDADTVRAALGAFFLVLSVKTTIDMATRLTRVARGANVRS
jgi:hypothetical protein